MINHMIVTTTRKGTTYRVYHHRDYVARTYTRRTYTEHDNLPMSVVDVLLGTVPATYDVTYFRCTDGSTGKQEVYTLPDPDYTIEYIVPTAMGSWTSRRRYKCKDSDDFHRCVNEHYNGNVMILNVNGIERYHKKDRGYVPPCFLKVN